MEDQIYWIWFTSLIEIGVAKKNRLLDWFGSPEEIYKAGESAYKTCKGLNVKNISYLMSKKDLSLATKAHVFMGKHKINLITMDDPIFPEKLLNIYNPPIAFYTKGNMELLDAMFYIGIVGSRKASPSGKFQAKKFADELSKIGITIVSGLAEGIDGESHAGSVNNLGSTIAVIGTGINRCYPLINKPLYLEIQEKGLIISEFFLDEPAHKFHFPLRNRLISGLSDGLLVVEAREKSGALITANLGLEQGKNVYAIPGDINVYQRKGSNQLIKDGAKVVTNVSDILEDFVDILPKKSEKPKDLTDGVLELADSEEKEILELLCEGYSSIDEIVSITQKNIREINSKLSMLELKGIIKVEYGIIYLIK